MHIGGLRSDNLYCKFGDLSRGTGRREIAFVRAASGFPLPFGNLRRFSKMPLDLASRGVIFSA
jgi:hypothetical protein